ncbi:MAG: hypothetical protein Ta2A_15410 [Treponemataceae bacterium]|nr:MAG: hypothetical protein Ta2A_15410 [Treponemataceae bacterium]
MQKQNRKKTKIPYCVLCVAATVFLLLLLSACSGFLDSNAFAAHIQRYTGKISAQQIVPLADIKQNSRGVFIVPADIAATGVAFQVSLNNHTGAELIPKLENDYSGDVDISMNDTYSVLTINLPSDTIPRDFDLKVSFSPVEVRRPINPVVLPRIVYKNADTEFWVDSDSGVDTDNYSGNSSNPFKTLEYALEYALDYALDDLTKLHLKAGNTLAYSGNIVIDGKTFAPIEIHTYGGGTGDVAKIVPRNTAKNIIEVKNVGDLEIKNNIVLTGATRAAALFVHSEEATPTPSKVKLYGSIEYNAVSGTPASAVYVGNKGAVWCYGTIRHNNSIGATQSSAVYVNGTNAEFTFDNAASSTKPDIGIYKNTSSTNGGAFYMTSGDIILLQGSIESNQAKNGGVAYLAGATGKITVGDTSSRVKINANSATDGGAFYLNGGTVTAANCTVNNNSVVDSGGVVYIEKGTFKIEEASGGAVTMGTTANNGTGLGGRGGAVFIGPSPAALFIASSGTIKSSSAGYTNQDVYVSDGRSMKVSGTVKIDMVYLNNADGKRGIMVVDGAMDNTMRIAIDTSNQSIGSGNFFVEFLDPTSWTKWSTVFSISSGSLGQGTVGDGGKHALYLAK